jgi:hypothetical protein
MVPIHHNELRVNVEVPDETVAIWRERGWKAGLHADTDPDDDRPVPRVRPAAEPSKAAKATTAKKG